MPKGPYYALEWTREQEEDPEWTQAQERELNEMPELNRVDLCNLSIPEESGDGEEKKRRGRRGRRPAAENFGDSRTEEHRGEFSAPEAFVPHAAQPPEPEALISQRLSARPRTCLAPFCWGPIFRPTH